MYTQVVMWQILSKTKFMANYIAGTKKFAIFGESPNHPPEISAVAVFS